jgi:hypothetical protein
MTYTWYKLFTLTDFLASELVSRTLRVNLETEGQKDILITRGNEIGVVYENTLLIVGMNGKNPYSRDGLAVYLDADQNVWLGVNPT